MKRIIKICLILLFVSCNNINKSNKIKCKNICCSNCCKKAYRKIRWNFLYSSCVMYLIEKYMSRFYILESSPSNTLSGYIDNVEVEIEEDEI
ncbi:MAG: hypothetical protein GY830_06375 [Bacteroidetes bacterium]|nr:hypothetical protein [Bacteroidota bacterium]